MRYTRSAQRQVVLRQLSNQLPVLIRSAKVATYRYNDSETVYFAIQDHLPFDRAMCLFVKCCVIYLFVNCYAAGGHDRGLSVNC